MNDLNEMDKYPWTGHSTILGRRKNPFLAMSYQPSAISSSDRSQKSLAEKTVEDVLKHFGKSLKDARRNYHRFVEKGIKHGRREDLQGGGLIRSSGGDKAGLLGLKKEDREKADQRILGSGDFACPVKCFCLSI